MGAKVKAGPSPALEHFSGNLITCSFNMGIWDTGQQVHSKRQFLVEDTPPQGMTTNMPSRNRGGSLGKNTKNVIEIFFLSFLGVFAFHFNPPDGQVATKLIHC